MDENGIECVFNLGCRLKVPYNYYDYNEINKCIFFVLFAIKNVWSYNVEWNQEMLLITL